MQDRLNISENGFISLLVKLAKKTDMPASSVRYYEKKDVKSQRSDELEDWLRCEVLAAEKNAAEHAAFYKHFEIGKWYRIYSHDYKNQNRDSGSFSGSNWESDCIFEFVKDEGIHHCFKAVKGGWSRTYTDAQLCSKKIEEVKNHAEGENN